MGLLGHCVTSGGLVCADDRHHDDSCHADPPAVLVEVAGGCREEPRRGLFLGLGTGGGVNYHLDALERVLQPLAGDDVDPVGSRDGHDVVVTFGEHVDKVAADSAARPGDGDPLRCLHGVVSSSSVTSTLRRWSLH